MPNTSGYNLRPIGAKVESRPANEKRTQQEGPVQSRGSREKQQYRLYAEDQNVLQGFVLSLTLCSVFLDGIEKVTSSGIRIAMFADDIVLWSSSTVILDFE
ncbi:hypothetical protein TNCV_115571 [Trichonephila clavipes]|nr:hypothetical protein TNCV_115571 [Trichonephila clavipes]